MRYGMTITRIPSSTTDERLTLSQGLTLEDRYVRDGDQGYVPKVTSYAGTGVEMIFEVVVTRGKPGGNPWALAVGILGNSMTDVIRIELDANHRVTGNDMACYLDELAAAIL